MADKTSFITIDRNILDWGWYTTGITFRVFIHLLLKANFADTKSENYTIHRGQVRTKAEQIGFELNVSTAAVRIALDNLKATGEIRVQQTHGKPIITVINYDKYQSQMKSKEESKAQPKAKTNNNKETKEQKLPKGFKTWEEFEEWKNQ